MQVGCDNNIVVCASTQLRIIVCLGAYSSLSLDASQFGEEHLDNGAVNVNDVVIGLTTESTGGFECASCATTDLQLTLHCWL